MTLSVETLDASIDEIFTLEDELKKEEDALKKRWQNLEDLKSKVLAFFDETDKLKYHLKGRGTVYVNNRWVVTIPKGENKAKFFGYLKDKGSFDEMITVHSATLNSYYQEEMEAALKDGNDSFQIPGIDEPKVIRTIRLRRES